MASKNIIICFDGTCNHPSDAKQEKEWFGNDVVDNGITNVLKLHVLMGGTLKNDLNSEQYNFYYSGVGTYGNKIQKIFNTAFSPNNLDVGRIIKDAGKDLLRSYEPNDKVILFGFSRGAAIARRFASVIDDYLPEGTDTSNIVHFMGLFDTVASIGVPNLGSNDKPVSDVVFEDGIVSKNVKEAIHCLAIDENRVAFQPTLMSRDERITEIWFSGAHADVGGGFWYDGLSDVSLSYMIEEIRRRNIGINLLEASDVDYSILTAPDGTYSIELEDVHIKPNHKGLAHPKDRWAPFAWASLGDRKLRVIEDDEEIVGEPIQVHDSVKSRITEVTGYRPKALKGIPHKIENTLYKGIVEHIT